MRRLGSRAALLRYLLLACAALLWARSASALDPSLDISQYAHTAWKVRDGFAKGRISLIAQTPDGYLWLGTDFGLLRFDGVRAVPWQPPGGEKLPSNFISGLLVARDGTLWIGTLKGLASYRDGKFTQYSDVAGIHISVPWEDRDHTIWFGTWEASKGRLCAVRNGKIECYGAGTFGNFAQPLYQDHNGNLWVESQIAVWRWAPGTPRRYAFPRDVTEADSLIEDDDGALLLATNGGLKQLVDGRIQNYPLPGITGHFEPFSFLRNRDGSLWIGTTRGLLHVHQGKVDQFGAVDGLSGDLVDTIFEDREGNVWAGTPDGLDRFRAYAIRTISRNQGLSNSLAASVQATSDGSIWIGTPDGLNRWANGHVTVYRAHRADETKLSASGAATEIANSGLVGTPQSLGLDDAGRLWVSTGDGVFYFERGRFVRVSGLPGGRIFCTAGDGRSGVWILQSENLFHWTPNATLQRVQWSQFGQRTGRAIIPDREPGGLWLGFYEGGLAYLKDGKLVRSYGKADGLGDGRVTHLRFGPSGGLWASTEDGLNRIKDGHIATLSQKNGLPCDEVHWSMEDEDHDIWLYMPCGLVRIARSELDAWINDPKYVLKTTVFDNSDGVRSVGVYGAAGPHVTTSSDGRIWFVPRNGVSVIDPHHLPFNKLPPPVYIDQITADRKTYDPASYGNGRPVPLPARIRDLEIDYTALSLVAPEKVRFRYKLEGRDSDWQEVGNRRQAFYTNLPPRHYRFRVMACNNSGVWNEAGTFLDFSVAPAYYQTTWFRLSCGAAFLALLWGLYEFLQSNERKLKRIINTMPTLAWSAAPDGPVDFLNQRWLDYTGLSPEQGLGWGWTVAVHPDDLNRLAEYWRLIMRTGEPGEIEARFRRFDGEYRWFLFRANAVRDESGKTVKWYGTNTDIDDRKRAEATLGASEAELRRAYDQATEAQRLSQTGSFTWDVQADDHMWSEEIYHIFGFEPGTKVTMEMIQSVIHPEDMPAVEATIRRAAEGADFDLVFRIVSPGGAVRHVHGVGHRIEQIADRPVLLGAVQDVTESKLAEESLNRARSELAHVTRVTTLNALTASIAHEVNQPLSGIVSNASATLRFLAGDAPNLEEAREAVRDIVRDGKRAGEIITRIRALTKKTATRREKLDLNETISEVLALIGDEAKRHNVIVRTQFDDALSPVAGDRVQLQQVVLNLVMNAIEAMSSVSDRPRELVITTQNIDADCVQATVEDSGIGIASATVDKIFDSFYTTKPGGMGMGLAISRSILQSHGGRLWAVGKDAPGTMFHFTVPKYREEGAHAPATGT